MKQIELDFHVARPRPKNRSDRLLPYNSAFILGPPVGSRVHLRSGQLGDTGARAEALAERSGATVIAYQDLGPTVPLARAVMARWQLQPDKAGRPGRFATYAAQVADRLEDILGAEDKSQVAVRTHSGNGALGTRLGQLLHRRPSGLWVSHVVASDLVSMEKISLPRGIRQMRRYSATITDEIRAEHGTVGPHPANDPRDYLSDVVARSALWGSAVAYDNLVAIGNEQPETTVGVHFPGNTLNGTADHAEAQSTRLLADVHRAVGDAAFGVLYVATDHHSTNYDNHDRNYEFVEWAINQPPISE